MRRSQCPGDLPLAVDVRASSW